MKRSLTTKFIAYFLVFSILPLITVGLITYISGKNAIEEQTFEYLTATAEHREETINTWISENEKEAVFIAGSSIFEKNTARLLTRIEADPVYLRAYEDMVKYLETAMGDSQRFFEIFYISPDGEILVSTDSLREGIDESGEAYFVRGKDNTFIQNIYISPEYSRPIMTVATPVKDDDGNLLGVLVCRLSLNDIDERMHERSGLGETGEVYLLNRFYYHISDPKLKGGQPLKEELHSTGVDECISGSSTTGIYKNYQEKEVFGAYKWLPERELCIVAEMGKSEVYSPIYGLRNGIIVAVAVLMGGLIFFVPPIARTMTKPIMKLVEGAGEIGKGRFDHRINVKTDDEIGTLSEAFNKMAEDIDSAQKQLIQSEKMASLGQLSAGVAHEINNPLANISLNAQMLQQDLEDEKAQKRLSKIEDNVDRATRIVKSLLEFSRTPEFHPTYTDINALITKTLDILKHETKRVEVVEKFEKELPEVPVDPNQIQQVFINIISNACQAMTGGGTLTLRTGQIGDIVEIEISDTGEGISPENLRKVFDPFFTTRKVGKGTGLGLSISYRIIEKHGGHIDVKSVVGKGTSFIIKLPAGETSG
jgi:two-component system NtrC family sensor kinase